MRAAEGEAVAPASGLRVLIAEDEAVVGMLLYEMLLLGVRPLGPAGSVARALALIEAEAASLDGAVLDVKLGREDACPVADRLRLLQLPFIFVTGYGPTGIPRRYAGTPVLEKPFDLAHLETLICRHFSQRRQG